MMIIICNMTHTSVSPTASASAAKATPTIFKQLKLQFEIWNFYLLVSLHQNTLFQDDNVVFLFSQDKTKLRCQGGGRYMITQINQYMYKRGEEGSRDFEAGSGFTCHLRTSSTSPRRTWSQPDQIYSFTVMSTMLITKIQSKHWFWRYDLYNYVVHIFTCGIFKFASLAGTRSASSDPFH